MFRKDEVMEKDNRDYLIIFPDGTYYSKNKSWGGVPLEKATWLTHSIDRKSVV